MYFATVSAYGASVWWPTSGASSAILRQTHQMSPPYFAHEHPHEAHGGPLDAFSGTALAALTAGVAMRERFWFVIKPAL